MEASRTTERWRAVDGWPGYEVSDHGRVRRDHTAYHHTYRGRVLRAADGR